MSIDRFARLERSLPVLFDELADARTPDYIDAAIENASARPQRPSWTFPERWLPVELVTSRVPTTRMPWRQLGVLALLALVLAAVLAAYIGSHQRRLPPAFGPAANGSIVFAMDGDVYTADPMTGVSKAIVTSTKTEVQPVYSLDGTRIAFGRADLLFVTGDNGGELTQVTPEPILGLSSWSFSPDGRSIVAFATSDQGPAIVVIPSDGKSDAKLFPVFATCSDGCDGPPQYRPDGSEIMFIGKEPGVANRAVYALDPATSKVRAIVPPSPTMDIHGASWSPDGMHLAYGTVDPTANVTNARTHVVKADGTDDVAVDANRTSIADFGFAWSNDGTRLTISRIYSDDGSVPTRSAIVPIDRSSPGIEIACPAGSPADDCTLDWSWSPDDTILLGTVDTPRAGKTQFLADPATGQIRDAPWTASGHPSWQRVAR